MLLLILTLPDMVKLCLAAYIPPPLSALLPLISTSLLMSGVVLYTHKPPPSAPALLPLILPPYIFKSQPIAKIPPPSKDEELPLISPPYI